MLTVSKIFSRWPIWLSVFAATVIFLANSAVAYLVTHNSPLMIHLSAHLSEYAFGRVQEFCWGMRITMVSFMLLSLLQIIHLMCFGFQFRRLMQNDTLRE